MPEQEITTKNDLQMSVWNAFFTGLYYGLIIPIGLEVILQLVSGVDDPRKLNLAHPLSMGAFMLLAAVFVAAWLSNRHETHLWEIFTLRATAWRSLIPLLFTVFGLSLLVSEWDNVVRDLFPMDKGTMEFFENLLNGKGNYIGSLIVAAVVAPIVEELVFRGLILQGLLRKYPPRAAIGISAFIFALIHFNTWQFSGAFLLGLLFGWLFWRTGSLWLCIVGHMANNSLPFVITDLLRWSIPGYNSDYTAKMHQPIEYTLAGLLICVVGIFVLHHWLPKEMPLTKPEEDGSNDEKLA